MKSQETPAGTPAGTPAASSSSGTAIPPEAAIGGHDNQSEDIIDIALSKPTGGFKLQILENIDPTGDFNPPIPAPAHHDLPRPPVPQTPAPGQTSVLTSHEIVNQQYDAEFQRLDRGLDGIHAPEDELEDYNTSDDDEVEDEDVIDVTVGQELLVTSKDYVFTCAPLNDELPQPEHIDISPTASVVIPVPKLAVSLIERRVEPISIKLPKRAAVEEDEQGTGVPVNRDQNYSSSQKRLAVEKLDPESRMDGSSSASDKSIPRNG